MQLIIVVIYLTVSISDLPRNASTFPSINISIVSIEWHKHFIWWISSERVNQSDTQRHKNTTLSSSADFHWSTGTPRCSWHSHHISTRIPSVFNVNLARTPLNFLPHSATLKNNGKLFRNNLTSSVNCKIAITFSASSSSEVDYELPLSVPFQQSYVSTISFLRMEPVRQTDRLLIIFRSSSIFFTIRSSLSKAVSLTDSSVTFSKRDWIGCCAIL